MSTITPEQLPTGPTVERDAEAVWHALGGMGRTRFVATGGPGLPDLYDDRGVRGSSPPLHRHPWPSWDLVVEGQLRYVIDGEEHRVGPGDSVYVPPGAAHTFVVESDAARVVGMGLSDGRFEELQRRAAALFAATPDGPAPEQIGALAAEVGVELLGPPLT